MDSTARFSRDVHDFLTRSGWFPGRRVDPARWSLVLDHPERPDGFQLSDPARAALEEFGGLQFRPGRTGVDHSPASVDFDPLTARGEEDRFDAWSKAIESRLYPLAGDLYGMYWVAMDVGGRVFLVGPSLRYVGKDITEGIENLVLGRNPPDFFELEVEDDEEG
ncbi:MAG TPA: SUKH-3 domain-containing protein [Candidatus Dormibacteraeota bacterium]|nr:SUKH-3 domain-containing protein [Candidatus Dormibacteraeota bacterium]